jgi:hypothetical protein
MILRAAGLLEHGEQTSHGSQEGNPFNQRCSKDHVGTNVVRSFRLASDSFNCTLTDLAYANTGPDGSKPRTYSSNSRLSFQQNCHQRHDTWFLL